MNEEIKLLRLDASCPEAWLDKIELLEKQNFSTPWTKDMLRRALAKETNFFFVALCGDSPAGYIGGQLILDELEIFNVAVDGAFRRRHLGRCLAQTLCSAAGAAGAERITLEVRAGNAPAIALYKALGFYEVGRRKNYYQAPREDAILMDLTL